MKAFFPFAALAGLLCGCAHEPSHCEGRFGNLDGYLEACRSLATGAVGLEMPPRQLVEGGLLSWEFNSTFKIVYADAKYLSFRAEEYGYTGGAHGGTAVTVGTFDRQTGRRLRLSDLVPEAKRPALARALRADVVRQLGGEENLQAEVMPIENFYVAADGLHFVYNEYEVACYAAGRIEVVVRADAL